MPTTLIRTVVLYLLIVAAMKIMGKRQIGQMQLSELVTVTMLSELASYSILDTDIPIIYSIAPVFILICIEVTISFLSVKSRFISKMFDGKPSYIVYKGELRQDELLNSRLSMTEVISEIRANGINSISEVYYMILEPNGKISVIPRISNQPLTPTGAGIEVAETGIDHALIIDGDVVPSGLESVNREEKWMYEQLKKQKINSPSDCFYFAINDSDQITVIKKKAAEPENKP